ncbi:hypothetical protein HYT52_00315 [Candidatus Woesearchaeota archaeon]|nr:hypothetical protein [Candidatus Woesearchaeota archaeon]
MQHAYFPEHYFQRLYRFIKETNKKDYLQLAKILSTFHPLRIKAKQEIPIINPKNLQSISSEELVKAYSKNRDWAHRLTVYDQFGWTAEDYWDQVMENILVQKYGIKKSSKEYFDTLFILTKPEEISTTLSEKRDVILAAINVKQGKETVSGVGRRLKESYGYMPVFAYGTPWEEQYFEKQIDDLLKKELNVLKKEYEGLKNYTAIRNKEVEKIVKKYAMDKKDLQIFIDFGLALDVRNEAEYLVSFTGYYLLPIYEEISHRLGLPIIKVRDLYEDEIITSLQGKTDPKKILAEKGTICGWGFDPEMSIRYNFKSSEAQRLFEHLNKTAQNLHGLDEHQGRCANNGKVMGRVRILLSPEANSKVQEGDVLIAHATTVDYLPAMKKAAAFVTEVGGLTCHAAVVAREFGVPCVVSLKNATKNFKDNDLVEVDADKGIVKRIK